MPLGMAPLLGVYDKTVYGFGTPNFGTQNETILMPQALGILTFLKGFLRYDELRNSWVRPVRQTLGASVTSVLVVCINRRLLYNVHRRAV